MSILKGLPRHVISEARRQTYAENQTYPDRLIPVPREKWPQYRGGNSLAKPIGVWRSKNHLVMIFSEGAHARLSICRTMVDADGDYLDVGGWEVMQRLKAECGFGDYDAVEVFPSETDVVNVANMRHIWILNPEDKLPFIWRTKK